MSLLVKPAAHNGRVWLTTAGKPSRLSLNETKCKCGTCTWHHVLQAEVDLFESLRTKLNQPIIILSGVRCATYNAKIGGAPQSQHLIGNALDVTLKTVNFDLAHLAQEVKDCGGEGIGIYTKKNFVHMDKRGHSVTWHDQGGET